MTAFTRIPPKCVKEIKDYLENMGVDPEIVRETISVMQMIIPDKLEHGTSVPNAINAAVEFAVDHCTDSVCPREVLEGMTANLYDMVVGDKLAIEAMKGEGIVV